VHAQAITSRAGPLRTIERKQAGRQFWTTRPAIRAREALAKHELLAIDELYAHETFRVGKGCFNRIGQTGGHVWPYDQTIYDNVNGVVQISIKLRKGIKQSDIAVDADAQKSLAFDLLEILAVLAFAMTHNGRQDE